MITKTCRFNVKSVDDQGKFSGYASVWDVIDSDSEVVAKGSMKRTLSFSKGVLPILHMHDPQKVCGWNVLAKEDDHGLYVEGQLLMNTELGRYVYEWAKMGSELGAKVGLSIGFRPVQKMKSKTGNTVFTEISLLEYSFVTWAANPEAFITTVKQAKPDLLENLNEQDCSYEEVLPNPDTRQKALVRVVEQGINESIIETKSSPNPGESTMLLPNISVEQALKAAKGEDAGLSDEQKKSFLELKSLLTEVVKQDLTVSKTEAEQKSEAVSVPVSMTFEAALLNIKGDQSEDRSKMESALCDVVENIKQSSLDVAEKKVAIYKAYAAYAQSMAEWQSKMIDTDNAALATVKSVKGVNTSEHVAMQGKINQARVHASEYRAAVEKAHGHAEKVQSLMQQVMHAYTANDIQPNPAGKKAEVPPIETKSAEPVIPPQEQEPDYSGLLAALVIN
jgi:HK97 family phage prohead protease